MTCALICAPKCLEQGRLPDSSGLVKSVLPEAEYDEISRIIKVQKKQDEKKLIGNIAVCTAGTADIPVAE